MSQIQTGHFESAGTAYNLILGHIPNKITVYNLEATAGEVFKFEWFKEMGDAKGIKHTVLADDGSTSNLSIDYVTTGGTISEYNSKVVGIRKSCTFDDTGGASEDLITCAGHGYINGEQVKFVESGGLPTNLSENTIYYVINSAASTFRVSLTKGGSAVDFGSDGTAPNYVFSVSNLGTMQGGQGVTVAAAFMADADEVYYEAVLGDRDTDIGDVA